MLSFGLLAFPILELKSPANTTSPCLLCFCTSTTTSLNFLGISFTVLFRLWRHGDFSYEKLFRSPFPWYPYPYAFVELCVFESPLLCHTSILSLGTLLPPLPILAILSFPLFPYPLVLVLSLIHISEPTRPY